jgi:hypothetical protein
MGGAIGAMAATVLIALMAKYPSFKKWFVTLSTIGFGLALAFSFPLISVPVLLIVGWLKLVKLAKENDMKKPIELRIDKSVRTENKL